MVQAQSKRQKNIKSKLMAAICMLLVSSIMMVSSTYAWFTLSTAPEVTGIQTAVGANGNLEMALVHKTGPNTAITSSAGDSVAAIEARNTTWGNLVDLSDTTIYGLDKIKLFPSAINIDGAGKLTTTAMLKTPTYGADGRVSDLVANTVTSYYDKTEGSFMPNDSYGVRAVGTASGMTERQLDYRNARAAANTAMAQAKNTASSSLNNNGSSLANIAIQRAADANATYDQTHVNSLKAIVEDLQGTDTKTGALGYIETAYMQSILAYAASNITNDVAGDGTVTVNDTVWSAVKGEVEKDGATLVSVLQSLSDAGLTLPTELQTAITEFNGYNFTSNEDEDVVRDTSTNTKGSTVDNVAAAKAKLDTLTGDSITWSELSEALYLLADTDNMEVNGIKANQITSGDNMSTLVNGVASGGLVVTMKSGGGVYADIADQCGDYSASVTIEEVTYNGLTLKNMNAKMTTDTSLTTPYLDVIATAVGAAGSPASGSATDMPITDMYGYVIDLAFRTNAADSSLKLQVEAADRIYSDNTNESTMGHGSSMTFASTTTDFSNDDVKDLMAAIRFVFFNPLDGTIYVNGKLDTANATVGADGVTAKMYLYTGSAEDSAAVNYVKVTDGTGTHKQTQTYEPIGENEEYSGTKYAQDATDSTKYVEDENGTYKLVYDYVELIDDEKISYTGDRYKAVTGEVKKDDNIIMPLTQNQQTALSVLVYLDGNNMGNDDVAATAATSMKGSMNLQFASSATLVPMEYADLHQSSATSYTVTKTVDSSLTGVTVSGEAKATANTAYSFTVSGDATTYTVSYAIGSGTATTITATNGTYTIPAASVTDNITITVAPVSSGS